MGAAPARGGTPRLERRACPAAACEALRAAGLPAVLARVYAARGIERAEQLATGLEGLLPPDAMLGLAPAARLLADAIARREKLLIVADYDADGATACAVGLRALRACGAVVDYVVPNRFEYGYGLTPEIVRLAWETRRPDWLITVDNGIAAVEGVAEANRLGLRVLVTDHHLPGDRLPDAAAIVNPNQPGCAFPSKQLAGVGVMFYLMLQLRAELRARGWFAPAPSGPPEPNLARLLDLVALGTVADVVRLDENNRILVAQGLQRIRAGRACAGIAALLRAADRDPARASTYDLGFAVAPRLNAAGRLDDMALGIDCLASDDAEHAAGCAAELDRLNRERRAIEAGMQDGALASLPDFAADESWTLTLCDPAWHQGVVGLLASRIKDRCHRPVIAFAPGADGELKGSGRSLPALHLRDALDLVAKRQPGLILKFGGHAAAAGLSIRAADLERFRAAFEDAVRGLLSPADLERVVATDGPLEEAEMTLELARSLAAQVWGQGFPAPLFSDHFRVEQQRPVGGGKHLKLKLRKGRRNYEAMLFFHPGPLPEEVDAAYRLEVNEYNGAQSLQLMIEHWQPG